MHVPRPDVPVVYLMMMREFRKLVLTGYWLQAATKGMHKRAAEEEVEEVEDVSQKRTGLEDISLR